MIAKISISFFSSKNSRRNKKYKDLLAENLVAPTQMEIYTCNIDGSDLKQITHLGKQIGLLFSSIR
jgi:arsenate reductase-like glutaredoxin family protein